MEGKGKNRYESHRVGSPKVNESCSVCITMFKNFSEQRIILYFQMTTTNNQIEQIQQIIETSKHCGSSQVGIQTRTCKHTHKHMQALTDAQFPIFITHDASIICMLFCKSLPSGKLSQKKTLNIAIFGIIHNIYKEKKISLMHINNQTNKLNFPKFYKK